jgi:hypothetical protein
MWVPSPIEVGTLSPARRILSWESIANRSGEQTVTRSRQGRRDHFPPSPFSSDILAGLLDLVDVVSFHVGASADRLDRQVSRLTMRYRTHHRTVARAEEIPMQVGAGR